jgi:hypothetical protein
MRKLRMLLVAVALALVTAAPEARAQIVFDAPVGIGVGLDGALLIGGIVTAIGVSVRPTLGWIIADFVFGGLNLLAGVSSVGVGIWYVGPGPGCGGGYCGLWFGLGLANVAVGVLDIVLGVLKVRGYRHHHPYRRYGELDLDVRPVPLIGRDVAGGLWSGVGVTVANF